jgi:hypothetical protein
MAAPLNKSAKKISSLFSSSIARDDSNSNLSQSSTSSHLRESPQDLLPQGSNFNPSLPKAASIPNISGHKSNTSITSYPPMPPPISTVSLSPLAPPPTLTNYGPPRPASSHGSTRSIPPSRASSRESSRSRPSTPTTMAPPGSTSSPIARTQLTPKEGKISKRHSWLPKRSGHDTENAGSQEPKGWIAGLREHVPYDLSPIFRGERVCSTIRLSVCSGANHFLDTGAMERESRHFRLPLLAKIWTRGIIQSGFVALFRLEEPNKFITPE